jgi:hypothetical protein
MKHESFDPADSQQIGPRILVYSCYFGFHEPFNAAATGAGIGYDRMVVTDHAALHLPGVTILRPDAEETGDPGRMSRLAKMCPHLFFSDYDWVIYIDNSAALTSAPQAIVAEIERQHDGAAPPGRYLFSHEKRSCAYREARLCMVKGKISRKDYRRQVNHYKAAGFPQDQGLFMNTLMIQKMGDAATDAFNETWFDHFQSYSRRDQISLPFLLWEQGYPTRVTPFAVSDIAQWPLFSKWKRDKFRKQVSRGNFSGLGAALRPELA